MKHVVACSLLLVTMACSRTQEPSLPAAESPGPGRPDWSADATVPTGTDRANLYGLPPAELAAAKLAGARHALTYPVTVTGLLVPYRATKDLVDGHVDALRWLVSWASDKLSGFHSFDDVTAWLGLQPYPDLDGAFGLPYPADGQRPVERMGFTVVERGGAEGFTFSCATCHVGRLFGRPVLGLTTRFPHANDFVTGGARIVRRTPPLLFRLATGATAAETALFAESRRLEAWVDGRAPAALGLDTSLAQVALSLARRADDADASMTVAAAAHPRPNVMGHVVADSKPAVWWNVKYKTRWLSDGSLVSGNPVYTNFLWNEIGRATDLPELSRWLAANQRTVQDLTAAVFANEAPRYTDFFPAAALDLAQAKAGQPLFEQHCARCHGTYAKGWDAPDAATRDAAGLLATTSVRYHERTPVVDVGTDPGRHEGMAGLAGPLNGLAISKMMGTVVEVEDGYVPPPLVGIWARWPYFHNNAAPSLCAVLTRHEDRPTVYVSGEPVDPATDFDRACNGYPLGDAVPEAWTGKPEHVFDTRRPGLSNEGHDEGIFLRDGAELLTPAQKAQIVEYLKTL